MNTWVEAPPPRKGLGCFARGCLTLLAFGVILAIACAAGLFWGFQRHSAIVHGIYWLAKTHSVAEEPAPVPAFNASEEQIRATLERWNDFKQKVRARQPVAIELTGDDVNRLLAVNRKEREKIFVSIEENRLRIETSLPLGEVLGRSNWYFNSDIAIQLKGAQSLEHPRLEEIIVNGQPVPPNLLNWKYRSRRLRDYLAEYQSDSGVGTVEIREGKLILRSRTE
jgi:hypothetical protein